MLRVSGGISLLAALNDESGEPLQGRRVAAKRFEVFERTAQQLVTAPS